MSSQVPYLSRLAREGSEPATLRPPRQRFAGDPSTAAGADVGEDSPGGPAGTPGSGAGARSDLTQPLSAFAAAPGENAGGRRAGETAAATAGSDPNASAPIRPDGPGRAPAAPDGSVVSTAKPPRLVDPPSATPGLPPLGVPRVGPARAGDPRAVRDTSRGQTPASWADPLWQTPVELPPAVGPVPPTRDAARRPAVSLAPHPAAGRSGSRRDDPADSPPRRVTDDAGISVTLGHAVPSGAPGRSRGSAIGDLEPRGGIGDHEPRTVIGDREPRGATGDAGRPGTNSATGGRQSPAATRDPARSGPAAVHDLLPPPSSSVRSLGPDTGGSGQESSSPRRPGLSIGTIEVTVVPPHAAPPTHDPRAAQAARNRPRPASSPRANPGVDRLRDGRRRWYGIAQG